MSNIDQNGPSKRKVAEHQLLDAQGAEVDNEEDATGIRYTLLANKQSFEWQSGSPPGRAITMLAVFGAKTLATNETSQARNNVKGELSPDEQIAAVRTRFEVIEGGKWVDRTREGPTVDLDKLASAVVEVLVEGGKIEDTDEARSASWTKNRAKMDEDKAYVRTCRNVPAVADAYTKLVGRQTKTVDDLLA